MMELEQEKRLTRNEKGQCYLQVTTLVLIFLTLGLIVGLVAYLIPLIENAKVELAHAKEKFESYDALITRTEDLLQKAEQIPEIDWTFLTNLTYQTKLITMTERILDHLPIAVDNHTMSEKTVQDSLDSLFDDHLNQNMEI